MKLSLATALAGIATEGAVLESKANSVLKIVKTQHLKDADAFRTAVRAAYKANGWNAVAGKPKKGSKSTPVPATVKQYVSTIRGAYKAGLLVTAFTSFYALREELKAKRAKARKQHEVKPEMIGLRLAVSNSESFNGAIFHDLTVLYEALDRARKPRMLSALERVKRDFGKAAPQLVFAEEERKAA